GPSVTISSANSPTAGFTAPSVTSDTLLRFELTVTDPRGESDTASVSITVSASVSPGAGGGGGGGGGAISSLALLLIVLTLCGLRRRARRG
ncbi:MAG: hypothetical protein AAF917_14740, partial [Pseudomonadota bacterium]